jgi:hypothetical protein
VWRHSLDLTLLFRSGGVDGACTSSHNNEASNSNAITYRDGEFPSTEMGESAMAPHPIVPTSPGSVCKRLEYEMYGLSVIFTLVG